MVISRIHQDDSLSKFGCNFCGENFQGKGDLMLHMKKDHISEATLCRNFAEGNCPFAEKCWFAHTESDITCSTNKYQCNLCDRNFDRKSGFMKHRKSEHETSVTPCVHANRGKCIFGKDNCWFLHDKQEVFIETDKTDKIIQYNQDVFDKLFGMMEKITERIVLMENVM